MTDYDKTNTFVLFVNDKQGNEKRPDRTGTLNVDGIEYYIDGWIKTGAKGQFLSGKIKPKNPDADGPRRQATKGAAPESDIPFNRRGMWD